MRCETRIGPDPSLVGVKSELICVAELCAMGRTLRTLAARDLLRSVWIGRPDCADRVNPSRGIGQRPAPAPPA